MFLPAAGWLEVGSFWHANNYGYYALCDTSGDDSAWLFSFRPHNFYKNAWPRERHASVRLATVVSELAMEVLILFLPAAGYRLEGRVYVDYDTMYSPASLVDTGRIPFVRLSSIAFYSVYPYWDAKWQAAVRLATVVSGLAGVIYSVPACCGLS